MHAVAAFVAGIVAFVSGLFTPPIAANSSADVQASQTAAAAVAQTEIAGNPFTDPAAEMAAAAPAPAFSPPPPQTVINQPVIERIIERVVPQGDSRISPDTLAAILADFGQSIEARLAAFNPPKAYIPQQVAAGGNAGSTGFFPASQRIDQLSNTAINTPTITGGTISNASISGYLPLSGGSLSGALFAGTLALSGTLAGTDANFTGTLTAGTLNVAGLSSQGALVGPYFTATSTSATSTFAGGLTAANSNFSILQNGYVGIGTTSPRSRLYIDGGTAGNNNLPFATISGGGDSPTSVQLLLRNTREGAGAGGQDYENEVHLRLQAGTTNEHRAYINFANKDGVDQWLTGKNASNVWILYNSTDGHRLWMESTGGVAPNNTGNTYLNSSGSGSVQINNGNSDGDTLGTGGFEVFSGGTYPRTSLFKVSSLAATDAVLKATNNGSGYAPASLLLTATNANTRGQGIFHYNTVSDTSWFTGVPYNVAGAKWMVGYESNATWDPAVAQTSKALFTIQSDGKVGIGTTTPAKLLDIYGTAAGLSIDASSGNPSVAFKRNSATDATIATAQAAGQVITGSATGDLAIRSESHSILFSTNSGTTAHMAIGTSGNVGIGTTTPTAQFSTTGTVRFAGLGSAGANLVTDALGNVTASSDERLKDKQGDFTRGLAAINAISPVLYKWRPETGFDTQSTYAGFFAQNVQTAIPEAVSQDSRGHLTLADRPILAALVNAVKELTQQMGDLAARVVTKELVAVNGRFDEVDARTLCLGSTCVTESQLQAMLAATSQSGVSPSTLAPTGTPQAPVLELNGNASSTIELGSAYNDLGARIVAPDNDLNLGIVILLDGATTSAVSVDAPAPGEHTILYTVTSPTTGLTGRAIRTVTISPAAQSPEPPANDNPFNLAPANDNVSTSTLLNAEPAAVSL